MADVKQILVVDDHFEMLEFLRSMLKMSNQEYEVLGVPSAEEGFLELRRTPFDLLITDVRLPGMSGFELVRRVQGLRPDIPIIMITAYSSPQGKEEAEELNIFRYFQKPLDTDTLLAAVHTALYGQAVFEESAAEDALSPRLNVSERVRNRLNTLRTDTGATQVVLAAADGTILFEAGENRSLNLSRLAKLVSRTLENSLGLADELQSKHPTMIHYQAGDTVDLYNANVGRDFCIMMLFDVQARRGRIGTVWIFAQRAIKDLSEMLLREQTTTPPAKQLRPAVTAPPTERAPKKNVTPPKPVSPLSREPQPVADTSPTLKIEKELEPDPLLEVDAEALLAALIEAKETDVDMDVLAGILAEDQDVDLDAFWDDALTGENRSSSIAGLSLEEAREKGLLPPEFNVSGDD